MATKKKTAKKKTAKKKAVKSRGGIASYIRKIQNTPAVKSKEKKIKELERKLAATKKEKARAVKLAQKKHKAKNK